MCGSNIKYLKKKKILKQQLYYFSNYVKHNWMRQVYSKELYRIISNLGFHSQNENL